MRERRRRGVEREKEGGEGRRREKQREERERELKPRKVDGGGNEGSAVGKWKGRGQTGMCWW